MNLSLAISRRTLLRMEPASPRAAAGFSILELLVVIAIIAVAMGIAGTAFRPAGGRPAKAMELVAGMAAVARDDAIATGSPTRVAICVDTAADVKYLRFVTALADADGNPATVGWNLSVRGQMLPQGTIFWPEYSTAPIAANTMKLDINKLAAVQDGTSGATFVFIEFDALGYPTKSGMQWVFAKAAMDDVGGAPVVPNPIDRDGFILRQTGRIAFFRSPEDISKP
jgi:prepilin-type N-terminal cleavage/methylation domain-containing protein